MPFVTKIPPFWRASSKLEGLPHNSPGLLQTLVNWLHPGIVFVWSKESRRVVDFFKFWRSPSEWRYFCYKWHAISIDYENIFTRKISRFTVFRTGGWAAIHYTTVTAVNNIHSFVVRTAMIHNSNNFPCMKKKHAVCVKGQMLHSCI